MQVEFRPNAPQHSYLEPNASVQVLPAWHSPAHPELFANKFELPIPQLIFVFTELWEKTGVFIPTTKREKRANFLLSKIVV